MSGVVATCKHCGRPVLNAIFAGGWAYHLECTQPPNAPVYTQAPAASAAEVRQIVREELARALAGLERRT